MQRDEICKSVNNYGDSPSRRPNVGRRHRRWFAPAFVVACLVLVLSLFSPRPTEASAQSRKDKIVTSLVINFVRFVRWPAETTAHNPEMHLCVIDAVSSESVFENFTDTITVGNKRLIVSSLLPDGRLSGCDVVFFGATVTAEIPSLLRRLGRSVVLTVSDSDRFLERGGMIKLLSSENRVHFEINTAAAEAAGIEIDSGLLNLATRVVVEPRSNSGNSRD